MKDIPRWFTEALAKPGVTLPLTLLREKGIVGRFFPFSGVVVEAQDPNALQAALSAMDIKPGQIWRRDSAPDLSGYNAATLLALGKCLSTHEHEAAHYYHFLSTPLGLHSFLVLLTGSSQIQREMLELMRKYKSTKFEGFWLPVLSWLRWMQMGKRCTQASRQLEQLWHTFSDYWEIFCGNRIVPLKVAKECWDTAHLLMKELITVHIDFPSGQFPRKVRTRLPDDSPSCPDPAITTYKICEGYAFLHEMQVLRTLPLPIGIKHEILTRSPEEYDAARRYIAERLVWAEEWDIKFIFDLATNTPADRMFAAAWPCELFWEDLHPGYRLKSIVETMASLGKPTNILHCYEEYAEEICSALGWPTPREQAEVSQRIQYVGYTPEELARYEKEYADLRGEDGARLSDGLNRYFFEQHRLATAFRLELPSIIVNPAFGPEEHVKTQLRFTQSIGPPFHIMGRQCTKRDEVNGKLFSELAGLFLNGLFQQETFTRDRTDLTINACFALNNYVGREESETLREAYRCFCDLLSSMYNLTPDEIENFDGQTHGYSAQRDI